jgi:competence protein ComEA
LVDEAPGDQEHDDLALIEQPASRSLRLRIGVGAGIVLLLCALVIAVVASIFAPRGTSDLVESIGGSASATPGAGADNAQPGGSSSTTLFVHVFGAVNHPGLFELRDGARVIDAVSAAGGFTDDADRGGVNLARLVADGEQIAVPREGEGPPATAETGTGGTGNAGATKKVSLNSASLAELATLPQIGPATAQRIVDWRTANGRFSAVEDLMSVSGIGQKTFDGLKDLISI